MNLIPLILALKATNGEDKNIHEWQSFLFILSTNRENEYTSYIELQLINSEISRNIERFISKYIVLEKKEK